ncbi:hypothetical protein V6Z11_A06G127700 [Gossypium hirsutum]
MLAEYYLFKFIIFIFGISIKYNSPFLPTLNLCIHLIIVCLSTHTTRFIQFNKKQKLYSSIATMAERSRHLNTEISNMGCLKNLVGSSNLSSISSNLTHPYS